jgi:uncharacterized membrane protein
MTQLATREEAKARQQEVQRRARGLGWMSLGLGVAQLAAPETVRRISGVDTGAVAGITAVDLLTAVQATQAKKTGSVPAVRGSRKGGSMELTATTTIRKPASEVFAFWRNLENLPTFMAHLEQVRSTGNRTSHWVAAAPFGTNVEWDAEIIDETPSEKIAWRSTGDADVPNAGTVRFVPAPDGVSTEVHVVLIYDIPGGTVGKAVAKYFGEEPHQQLDDDLRRLKQVVETGEVVRSDGAPWGKRARKEFPQRPAQPLSDAELEKGADA